MTTADTRNGTAVSAGELYLAICAWLDADAAMHTFLLKKQPGDTTEEQWERAHLTVSQALHQAKERAWTVRAAARDCGICGANG